MNIEIVEFYADKVEVNNQFLKGTLHVYLIDQKIDIRGIFVQKIKNKWMFLLPTKTYEVNGVKKRYPIFLFTEIYKNRELMKEIRRLGKSYIQKHTAELFDGV